MEQKNLKEAILNKLSSLKFDVPTIVVLKGFNRWLDEINRPFILGKGIDFDGNINLADVLSSISSPGEIKFAKFEDLIALNAKSLSGLFEASGMNVVIIKNDFFNLFYPFVRDEEVCERVKECLLSDDDNVVQSYYGEAEEYEDATYVAYNDIPNLNYPEENISGLLIKDGVTIAKSERSLDVPEEYDPVVLSSIIANVVENGVSNITVLGSKQERDGNIQWLSKILEPLGVHIDLRGYSPTSGVVDERFLREYLSILHRKNESYSFRDLKVYENPYEGNDLIDVNQSKIIDDIVQNSLKAMKEEVFRDVFVTAPTGAGKSVMFQIPAIYLAEKYNLITIVISPLIGLMNDQVANLESMTDKAVTINSDYTPMQKEEALDALKRGEKSILYLSPEALLANSDITNLIGERKIGLLVVDEAHIVATWGKSFRPDYWYLGDFINKLRNSPKSSYAFPIVTFTATSTFGGEDNMYKDIIESLKMTPIKYIGNVRRDDIKFDIRCKEKGIAYREEKLATAVEAIDGLEQTGDKVLVYVPYTNHIDELYRKLGNKEKVGKYYGGLAPAIKNDTLKQIIAGTKTVVLATKAFGMGIDIDDIKYVYHFAPTGNIADYVQEIGRAARKPGMDGYAITDFYKEDFRYINQLYGMSSIKNYQVIGVLRKIYELYTRYNRRNFMVSPEDFSYIFADQKLEEVDAKLKTTLLIIRKDFEADPNVSYPPIVFKPRSMFTYGYFMIKDEFLVQLRSRGLMKYFEKLNLPRVVKQAGRSFNSVGLVSVTSPGDMYRLNFKMLWEEKYRDMSFGSFKFHFMTNQLGDFNYRVRDGVCEDPLMYPRIVLRIQAKDGVLDDARRGLFDFLDVLNVIFGDLRLRGSYFSVRDLSELLMRRGAVKKRYSADTIASTIIQMINRIEMRSIITTGFTDYNSQTGQFRIRNTTYEERIYTIKKYANIFLANKADNATVRYVDKANAAEIVIAQLLELLDVADCDMLSGTNPEFFIRVNNPYAIEKIINNAGYVSRTVALVGMKHKESCGLMSHFFTNLKSDGDRWDFIEQYFLGQIDLAIIEECKKYKDPPPDEPTEKFNKGAFIDRINKILGWDKNNARFKGLSDLRL